MTSLASRSLAGVAAVDGPRSSSIYTVETKNRANFLTNTASTDQQCRFVPASWIEMQDLECRTFYLTLNIFTLQ